MLDREQMDKLAEMVPFMHHLGIVIKSMDTEKIVLEVAPKPEHRTTMTTVHGGFLMSLADCAGAIGAHINLPEGSNATTTTESKTNMLAAGKADKTLTATAIPISRGRRLQVWQTRIEDEDGKLVALTTQTQMNL